MRGLALSGFSVVSVFLFSLCLFLSDNLLLFWLFLELGALSLVPGFFIVGGSGALGGLFSYILVSAVSSSLIVSGLLYEDVFFLSCLGLIMKFGVFPFMGWVYVVVLASNWLVIWLLSTALKMGFFFFCFFISSGWDSLLVMMLCVFTFLVLSLLFWVFTPSWLVYWCHVLISSSASLILMALEVSVDLLLWLFVIYFVWSTCAIMLLRSLSLMSLGNSVVVFWVVFILVAFPFSVSIFYKLVVSLCMYSCGVLALLGWVVYNVSEQFFLVKYMVSEGIPRAEWSGVGVV
uniref:NADH dehydrogenase subunit 2 n=1 Tax=Haplorchis taichui TaxID=235153 RepID=A0A3G4YLF1_9TREM|nr:NADH dehydrogenase subunit 2 [Haplorchis taichui]